MKKFKLTIELGYKGMERLTDVAHALRELATRLDEFADQGETPTDQKGTIRTHQWDVVGDWRVVDSDDQHRPPIWDPVMDRRRRNHDEARQAESVEDQDTP